MESIKTKWHFEFFLNRTPTVCANVQYEQLVLTDMGSARLPAADCTSNCRQVLQSPILEGK